MNTRMDQAQFQHSCREQHFTAQTQNLLARLHHSPPARRVVATKGERVRFLSQPKMGVAIQFESSLSLVILRQLFQPFPLLLVMTENHKPDMLPFDQIK